MTHEWPSDIFGGTFSLPSSTRLGTPPASSVNGAMVDSDAPSLASTRSSRASARSLELHPSGGLSAAALESHNARQEQRHYVPSLAGTSAVPSLVGTSNVPSHVPSLAGTTSRSEDNFECISSATSGSATGVALFAAGATCAPGPSFSFVSPRSPMLHGSPALPEVGPHFALQFPTLTC
jgi:hypothetical protein